MSIHSAIYAKLSPLVQGRVYPQVAPQGTPTPRITWFLPSSEFPHWLTGTGGLGKYDVQIDCWGASSQECTDLAQACRNAIDDNRNVLWGSDTVRQVFVESRIDSYELNQDASEMPLFRSTLLVSIWIDEQVY